MGNICGNSNTSVSIDKKKESLYKGQKQIPNIKNFTNLKKINKITDFYKLGSELGKGAFGSVYRAKREGMESECALKLINKRALRKKPNLADLMVSELSIMKELSHPSIMEVREIIHDSENVYISTEIAEGGELHSRLHKKFDEKDAVVILRQLLRAINYLHKQNIIHRDIKPENILMVSKDKGNLDIKLTDFGFACKYDPKKGLDKHLGTVQYMAPEVLKSHQYTENVDVWAVGVITCFMVSGTSPFPGENDHEIKMVVCDEEFTFTNKREFAGVSKEAKDFILRALDKDITKRASAEQLLNHPWLKSNEVHPTITDQTLTQVANNLQSFCKATEF